MIAFIGVRSSWLMLARNTLFAWLAASAAIRASRASSTACARSAVRSATVRSRFRFHSASRCSRAWISRAMFRKVRARRPSSSPRRATPASDSRSKRPASTAPAATVSRPTGSVTRRATTTTTSTISAAANTPTTATCRVSRWTGARTTVSATFSTTFEPTSGADAQYTRRQAPSVKTRAVPAGAAATNRPSGVLATSSPANPWRSISISLRWVTIRPLRLTR
jgi:hypothetical protein